MIDLSRVRVILREAEGLVASLDGHEHDDSDAVTDQSKGEARRERAQRSQDLQFLASRLELAAAAVRIEYHFARGEPDPFNPERMS